MSNLPVIAGTYYDLRQVKSRGCWQIVIDVPAEAAEKLVETFGLPRQDEPTWLAVARLKVSPEAATTASASTNTGERPSKAADDTGASPQNKAGVASGESKGGWYGLKPSARAALLCKEEAFRIWVNRTFNLGVPVETEEEVAGWLRYEIGARRRDLDAAAHSDPEHPAWVSTALLRFAKIERAYRTSRGMETEEVGR